jgi:hypothetical protein
MHETGSDQESCANFTLVMQSICRMDLPGPTTSVGTRTNYSVGP